MVSDRQQLLCEAQKVTGQIVSEHRPERVVLFGSLANGGSYPQDIDLLVIKESRERKVKRAQEVYRSLSWSYPLDVVVRTPREVDEGLAKRNPFYVNALKGEVLYDARNQ